MIEKTGNALDSSVKSHLLNYWGHPDRGPLGERQTATPDRIDEFEARQGISFPADFREFHERVGGFDQEHHYQDSRGFNFWPLTKLARVSEYERHKFQFPDDASYFLFCDYLDFSWGYAIRLGEGKNDVVLVGMSNGKPKRVARSFTEFIVEYLKDSSTLYP